MNDRASEEAIESYFIGLIPLIFQRVWEERKETLCYFFWHFYYCYYANRS